MSVLSNQKTANAAIKTAQELYLETMGQPISFAAKLDCVDDQSFWATVEPDGDAFMLEVTSGLMATVAALWDSAYADPEFLAGVGQPVASDASQMAHISLVWLMLHEMHHIDLNHFDLMGAFRISETRNAPRFDIARRDAPKPDPLLGLPVELRWDVPLCLELQADHDAFEMLLDAYSTEEWESRRHRAMAVSAMMMLIEREDAKNGVPGRTHPRAATRIFQLLGHLVELPLIPAQGKAHLAGASAIDPNDLPSPDEQAAYNRQVVIPAFFDAVNLARIAGAETIRSDLGDPQDIFADIQIAKSGGPSRFASLKTKGAQEWSELVVSNERLKKLLSLWPLTS